MCDSRHLVKCPAVGGSEVPAYMACTLVLAGMMLPDLC